MIVAVPAPNSALSRSASSLSLASPSQTRLGRASARLTFLPAWRRAWPAAAAAAAAAAGVAADGLAPRLGADHVDLAHRPWPRPRTGRRRRPSALGLGLGLRRGDLGRLDQAASRASTSPCAVRSAAISTVRRSIRSGPSTGIGMSRSTSLRYQGEAFCQAGYPALAVDLLLEHDQAVQEGLRRRRAAGDVDVDREVLVDPRDDVVPLLERPAAGGAGAHRR